MRAEEQRSLAQALLSVDPVHLSDAQVLAMLISDRPSAMASAQAILHHARQDLRLVSDRAVLDAADAGDPVIEARIVAAQELARRIAVRSVPVGVVIDSARAAVNVLEPLLSGASREHLVIALMDRKMRLVGTRTLSIGNASSTVVCLNEIFRTALQLRATALILAHNHPSQNPAPSEEDRRVAEVVQKGARTLNMMVADFLVIGTRDAYFSFAEHGMLL